MGEASANGMRRLLVVDGDPGVGGRIEEFFTARGYLVDRAEHGAQALERLDRSEPDVIVADVLAPGIDGWTLYDRVRQRPRTAETPFLFLTAERDLPERLRGLSIGADDCIAKPFAVEELHARVEKILAQRSRPPMSKDLWLAGSVEHLAVTDLLQILALKGKNALIELRRGAERGEIVFENGRPVHAGTGGSTGKKALYRMLGWSSARFRVLPPRNRGAARTLDVRVTDAIMDGLVALDEWNRLRDSLPDARMRLEFTQDARTRLLEGKVTPAEFDVMARSRRGLSIAEIIEESQLPDGDLARAICALLRRGVVRPVAA